MHSPEPVTLPPLLLRLKLWAAALLGNRYAAVVDTADRAVSAFALTFATKLLGSGLDLGGVVSLSYLQTCAAAGLLAALSVIKSVVAVKATGSPALLAPVSRTLRARRDLGWRPQNKVPVRPPHRPRPHRPHPNQEGTP